jgi:hypothetical protein
LQVQPVVDVCDGDEVQLLAIQGVFSKACRTATQHRIFAN